MALVPRVADYRHIAEISCQMLRATNGNPLWRGDLVKVHGKGTYVIRSFEVSFELDPDAHLLDSAGDTEFNATYVRPATYTLERISESY